MALNYKAFEEGIRVAPTTRTTDPTSGKVGEFYWNLTANTLRVCLDSTGPTWANMFLLPSGQLVPANKVTGATLRWDSAEGQTGAWVENPSLLTAVNKIYTPSDATQGTDIEVQGGDTTGGANDGGDVVLKGGSSLGGSQGRIMIDSEYLKSAIAAGLAGRSLSVEAGDADVSSALDGGDLHLNGGLGDGIGSDGKVLIESLTRISATHAIDPALFVENPAGDGIVVGVTDRALTTKDETLPSVDSGNLLIQSGSAIGSGSVSGDAEIKSGESGAITGDAFIHSSSPIDTNGYSGDARIYSGDTVGAGNSGDVLIKTGDSGSGITGDIRMVTGQSPSGIRGNILINAPSIKTENDSAETRSFDIATGDSSADDSGAIDLHTGTGQNSGAVKFHTGNSEETFDSGDLEIYTGDVAGLSGNSGGILIKTGATAGTRGGIKFQDGSEGTPGYVLRSKDTLGTCGWEAFTPTLVLPDASVMGGIYTQSVLVTGSVTLSSSIEVYGDLTVQGSLTDIAGSNIKVHGDIYVQERLILNPATGVGAGGIDCYRDVTVLDELATGTSISMVGDEAAEYINVNGTLNAGSDINLSLADDATTPAGANITVNGDLICDGIITLSGSNSTGAVDGGDSGTFIIQGHCTVNTIIANGGDSASGIAGAAGEITLENGAVIERLDVLVGTGTVPAATNEVLIGGDCRISDFRQTDMASAKIVPALATRPATLTIDVPSAKCSLYDSAGALVKDITSAIDLKKMWRYDADNDTWWAIGSSDVDNVTIEISSELLQVKDDGITSPKIEDLAVTDPKLASGVTDEYLDAEIVGHDYDGTTGSLVFAERVALKFVLSATTDIDKLSAYVGLWESSLDAYIFSHNVGGNIPDSQLYAATGSIDASGALGWLEWDFNSPTLAAGTYYLVLGNPGDSAPVNSFGKSDTSSDLHYWNGTQWIVASLDLAFKVFSTDSSAERIVKTKSDGLIDASLLPVVASGYDWARKTASYTAVDNDGILADTVAVGAFQVSLPAAPPTGTKVKIIDTASNFDIANLTVATTDSSTFNGTAGPLLLDVQDAWIELVFDATIGANGNWFMGAPSVSGGTSTFTSVQIAAVGGGTIYSAASGDEIITDTATNSAVMTIKLPTSALLGEKIKIIDGVDDWGSNAVTIDRNGHNIDGIGSNFTGNVDGAWIEFIYMNPTQGWRTVV